MGMVRSVLKNAAKKALLVVAAYGAKRIADKLANRAARSGTKGKTSAS